MVRIAIGRWEQEVVRSESKEEVAHALTPY